MVNRDTLRADALAGLSGAIILVPQAVAYASIAGLPPEYGLYTAMVPVIIAALFGSSWHLVSGPTAAISIVIFATISPLAAAGSAAYVSLVLTLTFMVGVLTLAMSAARLGSLVNFVSQSVVVGFTAGAAILIATSQLKNFFGLAAPASSSFLGMLGGVGRQLGHLNPYVTAVGAVTLASGLLSRRFLPRASSGRRKSTRPADAAVVTMMTGPASGVERTRAPGGVRRRRSNTMRTSGRSRNAPRAVRSGSSTRIVPLPTPMASISARTRWA